MSYNERSLETFSNINTKESHTQDLRGQQDTPLKGKPLLLWQFTSKDGVSLILLYLRLSGSGTFKTKHYLIKEYEYHLKKWALHVSPGLSIYCSGRYTWCRYTVVQVINLGTFRSPLPLYHTCRGSVAQKLHWVSKDRLIRSTTTPPVILYHNYQPGAVKFLYGIFRTRVTRRD